MPISFFLCYHAPSLNSPAPLGRGSGGGAFQGGAVSRPHHSLPGYAAKLPRPFGEGVGGGVTWLNGQTCTAY